MVDFVKIDAEGSEARILAGAERLFGECRPIVACEVNSTKLGPMGHRASEIYEFFARHGLRESNAQLRARALRATDGPIDWRLHNTDFAQSLISHFVCSYRCSASISLADALLDALRREHPEEATRLVGVLQATLPALVDRLDGRSPAGQTPPEPVQ